MFHKFILNRSSSVKLMPLMKVCQSVTSVDVRAKGLSGYKQHGQTVNTMGTGHRCGAAAAMPSTRSNPQNPHLSVDGSYCWIILIFRSGPATVSQLTPSIGFGNIVPDPRGSIGSWRLPYLDSISTSSPILSLTHHSVPPVPRGVDTAL